MLNYPPSPTCQGQGSPGRLAYTWALISPLTASHEYFPVAKIFSRPDKKYFIIGVNHFFSLGLLRNDEATIRTTDNPQLSITF